ncbi:hypothetical protein ACLKMH_13365 [Psychromonas sp. KJ10-10]|uniref:hypothetical protein n=1 Tax=Psychromonas sp. KJ10-10 TaxID=3391823 RepID=UPI0039B3F3EE
MKNSIIISPFLRVTFTSILSLFIFVCSMVTTNATAQELNSQPKIVQVKSIDLLRVFFKEIGYLETSWKTGKEVIPRFSFEGITDSWATKISELSTKNKKSLFFRLMTPLILIANENILAERKIVETAPLDSKILIDIAVKYHVFLSNVEQMSLTEEQRILLLRTS